MAGLGGRTEFDDLEDELLRWATEWDEADAACMQLLAYIKLARLKGEKIALLTRIAMGGCKRNQDLRFHVEHHRS